MTLRELSQLYYLKKEIEHDRQRLAELRSDLLSPKSPSYDGMPKSPNPDPSMERRIAQIADLEAMIQAKIDRCVDERQKLELYIAEIPDSLTRQIFTLRFINGMTWPQIAYSVGGNNTEASAKMTCYRYIKKSNE